MKSPAEIIVVSGLPRSGTSLMMQMLERGGLEVVTDQMRGADENNPRGYYELEAVKRLKQDASWLPQLRGKAVKVVSQLLFDLPSEESYRVIFMDRDPHEMLASQEKMLQRLGRTGEPRETMLRAYTLHLDKLHAWLCRQTNMAVLRVSFNRLMERPLDEVQRVNEFLGGVLKVASMCAAVDPALYRNRR